jgi:predicted cupin superfamily sugar epimerase
MVRRERMQALALALGTGLGLSADSRPDTASTQPGHKNDNDSVLEHIAGRLQSKEKAVTKREPHVAGRRRFLREAVVAGAAVLTPTFAAEAKKQSRLESKSPDKSALTADEVLDLLKLEPNATCGFVRETFVSKLSIAAGGLPAPFADRRPLGSALYFMVTPDAPVRLHRIRNDQLYHYYLGDPIELFLLHGDGTTERIVVGPDIRGGQRVQLLIPGNTFHTARLLHSGHGSWFLGASTEWPGVVVASDVEIGNLDKLAAQYPTLASDMRAIAASAKFVPPNPAAPR